MRSHWRDLPLATKLAILIIILAIAPLALLTLYDQVITRGDLENEIHTQDLRRARSTAAILDDYLHERLADIRLIAIAPTAIHFFQQPQDREHRAELITVLRQTRQFRNYQAVYLADQSGKVLAASDDRLLGRNYITAPYFRQAIAGQVSLDDPRYDPEDAEVYLHLSAPVRVPDGTIVGAVIGRLLLSSLDSIIAADSNYAGRGSFGVLWDDLGIRLSHGLDPDLRFKPYAPLPADVLAAMVAEGRFGPATDELLRGASQILAMTERSRTLLYDPEVDPHLHFDSVSAGPVHVAMVPLKSKRWLYGIFTPDTGVTALLNAESRRALLMALSAGLLAIGISLVAAHWAIRPIRAVADTARAIASGDMTRRVGLRQRDEVGQLAATFDAMADTLAEQQAQLRGYAAELEQRVEARTKQIQRHLQYVQTLREVDSVIKSSLDLKLTLSILLEHAVTQLEVDAADVLLLEPRTCTLVYAAGRGFRSKAIERSRVRLGEGHAGRAALERCMVTAPIQPGTSPFLARADLLAGEAFVAHYVTPLIAKGQVKGVLEIFHRAPLHPDDEWLGFLEALAGQASIAIDQAQLFDELQQSNIDLALAYDATIEGWSRALDLRDKETEGHTQRVTEMTLQLAHAAGMTEEDLVHVRRGALLHDIGKMGVPDAILFKPGPLTDEEWAIMRRHPQLAYDMLSPIAHLRPALDIPWCHHEKWDGSGYPRGLKGEQIPLAARLFAVVDVWDALRSDRPYRPGWPNDRVLEHICSLAGTHFDPKAVELFCKILNKDARDAS